MNPCHQPGQVEQRRSHNRDWVPRGLRNREEGTKEGAQKCGLASSQSCPTDTSSLSPQKASPHLPINLHPSRRSTVPMLLLSGCVKFLYHPPNLEYPSCYQDEKDKDRNRVFLLPPVVMGSHSQSVVPRPAASAALRKLFTMLIRRSHTLARQHQKLGGRVASMGLSTSPPGGSVVY